MKRLKRQVLMLILLANFNSYAQTDEENFATTLPCSCSPVDYGVTPWRNLQDYMKRNSVNFNCQFEENGIESRNFVELNKENNIRIKGKLSVICTENGLKIQMIFREGRNGTSFWTEDNQLTPAGQLFAKEIYKEWKSKILEIICTQ